MESGGSSSTGCSGRGRGGLEEEVNKGIMDERILILVFRRLNWDPQMVCVVARVSRRLRAVVNRVLWREVCISRAPRMLAALTAGAPAGQARVNGGWNSLAKLLFYCSGGVDSRHFPLTHPLQGHFAGVSRFSKTSGSSFLSRRCSSDLLYVSDPCEHTIEGAAAGEDLGAYRGVFRGFIRSKTRAYLIGRHVELEQRVRCPYCGARVWSMTAARLVPRTAARRLGAHLGRLEYFVCVNGHLHGNCWLAHLSDGDDDAYGDDGYVDGDHDD
ncbi:hypothetical protein KFK09_020428 [Dendrobium nobile]|uniref:F-box domain-containing protein n=1 Tax=Dendrobium nobile TaxID=94219 RepID=A0A8T3AKY5_DENNO|nr:hypothetical protein KFK09_020428 [Dendrobium nobile]